MGKFDRLSNAIGVLKAKGDTPTGVLMSRSFASALKTEMIPVIDKHFIDGRMTIDGIPWIIRNDIRGYQFDFSRSAIVSTE